MDYKKNLKYFQSNDKHFYIGICILVVGAILFSCTMLGLWFIPYQYYLSFIIAAAGACIAFIPRSMRSNSSDLDFAVAQATAKYEEEAAKKIGIENMLLRTLRPVTTGAYVFDENVLVRRAKGDRKVRTSLYCATALLFTEAGIYTAQKKISLIEDSTTENIDRFIYDDIDGVSVETEEKTLADGSKITSAFIVITSSGKEAARIPTVKKYDIDILCDDINHTLKTFKK